MKTKAAVCCAPHTEYQVKEIELDSPKDGEVLGRSSAASGMCHSDEHLVTGDMVLDAEITAMMGWQQFPIVAGHEGAGEVVEVGPNVRLGRARDHVGDLVHPLLREVPACRPAARTSATRREPCCRSPAGRYRWPCRASRW